MKLYLYKTSDSFNTIGKTLTDVKTIDINLKNNVDLYNPSLILINNDVYKTVNYAKLLDRYYFVEISNHPNNKFIVLNLNEDVLETYKDDILNTSQDIIKKSSAGNIKQENVLPTTISKTFNSDKTLTKSSSIIMVTSGQPINTGSDNKDDTRG